uniref:WWE domain-containing protein n=1 Tax=Alexandrium monilatum TaxID=311494 RepID=A0A7S4V937_9DINO|mmetsp:Transcript_21554/g.64759  ORF Transcript_21554/g.64759 Transcript_21554/m.64759 type:complete len:707 (+) Transcript_21554:16-2136(+)
MSPSATAASSTIMAHWQFLNDEDGSWQGFSQTVSVSLENAFLQWLQDPHRSKRPPATVRSNQFKYVVNFYSATEEKREQKLRRISLVEAETAQAVTVDSSLWGEYSEQREAVEVLRAQLEGQVEAAKAAEEATQGRIAELEAQVRELEQQRDACQRELEELRQELEAERTVEGRTLPHLSYTPFPGRLVSITGGDESPARSSSVPVGSLGRVRALEGTAAAVDFPTLGRHGVWIPCEHLTVAVEAELMSRPGSLVAWVEDDGSRVVGVVCDSVDEVTVNVLGPDGRKRPRCLLHLDLNEYDRESSEPLEVGDLVRRCGDGPGHERVGMVIQATEESLTVRFREDAAGGDPGSVRLGSERCEDLCFTPEEAEERLRRLDQASFVRPLSSVRFRPGLEGVPRAEDQSEVGVAYAVHADGTVVVDFLGNMGCRCGMELLEVVDLPQTMDHSLLCLLSELLSWHEVSAQHWEEERDDALLQMLDALPAQPSLLGQPERCRLTEWPVRTDVFKFVAKLLLGSMHASSSCQPQDGEGVVFRRPAPLLCVERVEQIGNDGLQRLFALVRDRSLAAAPRGDGRASGVVAAGEPEEDLTAACAMPPGPSEREAYLWWGGPWEAAERVCTRGFAAEASAGGSRLRFSACAADADLRAEPRGLAGNENGVGLRCLILARVLLEGAPPAEARRCREHVVRNASHALPLFRVHYRHAPA